MKNTTILLAFCLLLFVGCTKNSAVNSEATRSFYMGTTPWPAALTIDEVNKTYQFINNNCDIVSHHFDEGIPYQEAFTNAAMPVKFIENVQFRKSNTAPNQKVFLSVAALSIYRTSKAPYYAESTAATAVKDNWQQLACNDPKVVTAYVNFISWLINQFNPTYINYGVESNSLLWNAADFANYKQFLQQVYTRLKQQFPTIPFFISFMVDESEAGYNNAVQLMEYTDFIGLSSYPYITVSSSANGNTNPQIFPANYYERFININPAKPLAFAETGYIAQPLLVPDYNLDKQGNDAWQNAYLEMVLALCNNNRAKLFIWFCPKDYDAMVADVSSQGNATAETINLLSLWKDTGLMDENDRKRPAFTTWQNWFNKKRQ